MRPRWRTRGRALRSAITLCALACFVLLPGDTALGQEGRARVFLADGTELVGHGIRLSGDSLSISTRFADRVTLARDAVRGLATRDSVVLEVRDGARLRGIVTYARGVGQTVSDPVAGTVPVPMDRVVALWPVGAPTPAELARARRARVLRDSLAAARADWSASLDAGLNGKAGNSELLDTRTGLEVRRETSDERLLLSVQNAFTRQEGSRTANETVGTLRLEVDVSHRFFVFGATKLEFDEFEMLDLRTALSAGAGYLFLERDRYEIRGRIGAGFQHESFDDDSSASDAVAELGYDVAAAPAAWLRVEHGFIYYPTLSEPIDDYRFSATTAIDLPLAGAEGWRVRIGVRNDFDARPQPGVQRLDTSYFVTLGLDLD